MNDIPVHPDLLRKIELLLWNVDARYPDTGWPVETAGHLAGEVAATVRRAEKKS